MADEGYNPLLQSSKYWISSFLDTRKPSRNSSFFLDAVPLFLGVSGSVQRFNGDLIQSINLNFIFPHGKSFPKLRFNGWCLQKSDDWMDNGVDELCVTH